MVLKEYLFKGFALDEECLKNPDGALSTSAQYDDYDQRRRQADAELKALKDSVKRRAKL